MNYAALATKLRNTRLEKAAFEAEEKKKSERIGEILAAMSQFEGYKTQYHVLYVWLSPGWVELCFRQPHSILLQAYSDTNNQYVLISREANIWHENSEPMSKQFDSLDSLMREVAAIVSRV